MQRHTQTGTTMCLQAAHANQLGINNYSASLTCVLKPQLCANYSSI